MLTLTENASTIVKTLVDQNLSTEDAGLRFSQEGAESGGLTVETAEQPVPGDAVVEKDGAKVYLDETAAVVLGDQVLDAAVDESGGVQFSLLPSEPVAT
jgi:Fe-S cluster assembly iron-binding protein IscA